MVSVLACWRSHSRTGAMRFASFMLQLADEIWVIHAFHKKSKHGFKTPKHEIDLVKDRLKKLKEAIG